MKEKLETPEEFAVRVNSFLHNECEVKRPEGEELGYCALIWKPKVIKGDVTIATNSQRKHILQFMEEFIERNKPARGRGK